MDREILEGRKIELNKLYQDRATIDEVEGSIKFSTSIGDLEAMI
jgi:hypothetical protein